MLLGIRPAIWATRGDYRWAFGIDAVQALGLAFHVIAVELQGLAKAAGGGKYWFLGESGMTFPDGCSLILDPGVERRLRTTGITPRLDYPTREQQRLKRAARRRTKRS
jgi:hypothetical protein